MTRSARPLALPLLLALAVPVLAAVAPIPPAPNRWVTDESGFLSPTTRAQLDAQLESYEQQTGHQVLVYIGKSTGGVPVEDWAVRAFADWKVGRQKLDDGLVLFIFPADRKMRIEVGYGLEDRVPDAVASRIIREVLTPGFRAGQNDAAVTQAVSALLGAIEGKAVPGVGGSGAPKAMPVPSTVQLVFFGIVALAFLLLLITHPSLALNLLFLFASSGRRRGGGWGGGSWGGGGGGFSGGGGRSGGGGASGSW